MRFVRFDISDLGCDIQSKGFDARLLLFDQIARYGKCNCKVCAVPCRLIHIMLTNLFSKKSLHRIA